MNRPSFQFYPADWKSNANLRRCSMAARGAWVEILCLLHDAEEYGIARWPLADLAHAAGVPLKLAEELAAKKVLKGSDGRHKAYIFTPSHAGINGDPVQLLAAGDGPCWYSSRFIRDEYVRQKRGVGSRFEATPKPTPKPPIGGTFGGTFGDGPSSSSSSSHKDHKAYQKASRGAGFKKHHVQMTDRMQSAVGNDAWRHDRAKWMTRIKADFEKSQRVIAEVENAAKEGRIETTPAQYAEQIWKEFA